MGNKQNIISSRMRVYLSIQDTFEHVINDKMYERYIYYDI